MNTTTIYASQVHRLAERVLTECGHLIDSEDMLVLSNGIHDLCWDKVTLSEFLEMRMPQMFKGEHMLSDPKTYPDHYNLKKYYYFDDATSGLLVTGIPRCYHGDTEQYRVIIGTFVQASEGKFKDVEELVKAFSSSDASYEETICKESRTLHVLIEMISTDAKTA